MKYVFGPVPSRRLGQSLGIDPVPFKSCNWNCIYCQLGRTSPLTVERQEFFAPNQIISEVKCALESHTRGSIDWITFVGSGETTLHRSLGRMIREVQDMTDIPVAVMTNGSLLYRPEVREELLAADAVLPALDADSESLFLTINRPSAEITFERFVKGMVAFRRLYSGKLWIEVMLVKGLNDTEPVLTKLAAVLRWIGPEEVHLNVPVRPPSEAWVQAPDAEGLMRANAILGEFARVISPVEGTVDLSGYDTVVDAVVGVITRHPMGAEELTRTVDRWTAGEVARTLTDLEASGRVQVVARHGKRFYSAIGAHYGAAAPACCVGNRLAGCGRRTPEDVERAAGPPEPHGATDRS